MNEQSQFCPEHLLDAVRQQAATAKASVSRITKELEAAQAEARLWAEIEEHVSLARPLHLITWVDKNTPRLKQLRIENPGLAGAVAEVYRSTKTGTANLMRRYAFLLEAACKNVGVPLDTSSRHPKYSVEDRFFSLEIDEAKLTARLSDTEGRLAEIPADVDAVAELIKKERDRIFGRPFSGAEYLSFLRKQYLLSLKTERKADGDAVPIRSITRRLGKNLKGFRTDEFLLDLSRLAQHGPHQIDGRQLDLQQTKNTNEGMLLHGAAGRGYVGYIVFREAAQ